MSDFEHISEGALAEALGVSRKTLADARAACLSDADVLRKKNGAPAYLPAAIPLLCAHLGVPVPVLKKREVPAVQLQVVRAARLNHRIVFAIEKTGSPEIAVRVRDARMFVPGQRILARVEGQLATLHGPQPRKRGRSPQP